MKLTVTKCYHLYDKDHIYSDSDINELAHKVATVKVTQYLNAKSTDRTECQNICKEAQESLDSLE